MEPSTGREAGGRLALTFDYELTAPVAARFAQLAADRGLAHVRGVHWNCEASTLDALLPYASRSSRFRWTQSVLLDGEPAGCLTAVWLKDGVFSAHVAADSLDDVEAGVAFLRGRMPELAPSEEQKVPVTFWAYGSCGAEATARSIAVPTWADIGGNYPAPVAARLAPLMDGSFRPSTSGQLILWHGEPGTGKTYALRALAWQWRGWCSLHYVTDPDTLFGRRADYLLDVLVYEDDDESEKWQLLVLEDTGELLGADAKTQSGQGLSRLLNVVDGILGQGLRVLVLVTTNDDLRSLHPAVSRPGRCLSCVEFVPFTHEEAAAWLERNGVASPAGSATLAGLFATAEGHELPVRRAVGFVR